MSDKQQNDIADPNEKGKKIIDSIIKILDENNVSNILISFGSEPDEPIVFYRGNFYEIAKLTCRLANNFKKKISDDLLM